MPESNGEEDSGYDGCDEGNDVGGAGKKYDDRDDGNKAIDCAGEDDDD